MGLKLHSFWPTYHSECCDFRKWQGRRGRESPRNNSQGPCKVEGETASAKTGATMRVRVIVLFIACFLSSQTTHSPLAVILGPFRQETDSGFCPTFFNTNPLSKTTHTIVYWLDGYERNVDVSGSGEVYSATLSCIWCWPDFDTPTWEELTDGTAYWDHITINKHHDSG